MYKLLKELIYLIRDLEQLTIWEDWLNEIAGLELIDADEYGELFGHGYEIFLDIKEEMR